MNREEMIRLHDKHNDEELSQGKIEVADEIFAPNYYGHYAGMPDIDGREGQKQQTRAIRAGFPDIHFTVNNRLVEGDKIFVQWSATGTHTGEYMGIPATGKEITVSGMVIHQVADGQFKESWECVDSLSMLQQLGLAPPLGG